MAEEEGNEQSGWWGMWNSAKAKSVSVLEAVKKDLGEISTAVKTEATNIAESLKIDDSEDSTASTVKKSLSSFFGQVTEALIPSMEEDESEAILITHDGIVTLTGFQKHLAELQANDDTYLVEPSSELDGKYRRWLEVIEQDQFTEPRLAKHLTLSQILHDKYTNLVPERIPHMEFWKRYLFKRALLEDALANADIAEKRAKEAEIDSTDPVSPNVAIVETEQPKKIIQDDDIDDAEELLKDDLKWASDDIISNVELSEEEQARLLAEYEQEIQEREKKRPDDHPILSIPNKESSTSQGKPSNNASQQSNSKGNKAQNNQSRKQQSASTSASRGAKSGGGGGSKQPSQGQQGRNNKTYSNETIENKVLKIENNHFKKEEKDNLSSNSDESWEKEFDLDDIAEADLAAAQSTARPSS